MSRQDGAMDRNEPSDLGRLRRPSAGARTVSPCAALRGGRTIAGQISHRWRRLADGPRGRRRGGPTANGMELAANDSGPAPAAGAPIVTYAWRGSVENPSRLAGLPAEGPRVALAAPTHDGEYRVTLRVVDA